MLSSLRLVHIIPSHHRHPKLCCTAYLIAYLHTFRVLHASFFIVGLKPKAVTSMLQYTNVDHSLKFRLIFKLLYHELLFWENSTTNRQLNDQLAFARIYIEFISILNHLKINSAFTSRFRMNMLV
jgi:hypothetical protein